MTRSEGSDLLKGQREDEVLQTLHRSRFFAPEAQLRRDSHAGLRVDELVLNMKA